MKHPDYDNPDRDWLERRGRFEGIEWDTPDRQQIKPIPEPDERMQTHAPHFERERPEWERAGGDDDS